MHRQTDHTEDEAIYDALVLGTRDYVRKCGFSKALVGLSGGIDSALVAAIAVDALGKENVLGIGMPSPYSSHRLDRRQPQARRESRHPLRSHPHQALFSAIRTGARAALRRHSSPTSRKRISSRASAACCSWRCPTSSARSCSPPATRSRDVDRLLHALRRHGRRARGHRRRRQDPGLCALPLCQSRPRDHPRRHHREAALRRAPPGAEGHRLAAALRRARSDSRSLRRAL